MKTKLTPIYKIPMDQKFKYRGHKYIQLMRPINCKAGKKVTVARLGFDCEWVSFPSGRLVKPVIVCNNEINKNGADND
jgi:hypothetical protein